MEPQHTAMENKDNSSLLSKDDINRLLADRTTRAQVDVAAKLAKQFAADGHAALTSPQQQIAQDIFRLLMTRSEMIVRAMLAMNLSQTDKLPKDIAMKMAQDTNIEVAGPVLQYSDVLDEEDLAEIIGSMVDSTRLQAIARRDEVPETISDMLVSTNLEVVVATLVQNEGARISEQTFNDIIQHHRNNPEVVESIFQRSTVPVAVIDKVVGTLSQKMRTEMEKKYGNLNHMKAMKAALEQSLEAASLKMMGFTSNDRELMRMIRQLEKTGKLSPFSALAMCNLQLFEVSLSRILRVPLKNVHILLQDASGFKIVYDRAKLPAHLFEATMLAAQALRAAEQEGASGGDAAHIEDVIRRMRKMAKSENSAAVEQLAALMQHTLR